MVLEIMVLVRWGGGGERHRVLVMFSSNLWLLFNLFKYSIRFVRRCVVHISI